MFDLIIIGAGPAGLTAALYSGRSRLKTLLIEKMIVGGRILLSEKIENYPGFPGGVSTQELIQRMEEQIKELDIEIIQDEVIDMDCKGKSVKTISGVYSAKSIILACGSYPRKLNITGEERLTGRGVSYCATCDGPLYREKNVVIVGGGNAVAEEAIYLSRLAKTVNIIHRRNDLRASAILQEKLKKNPKINFILSSVVSEILGSDKLEALKVKDVNTQAERILSCDGVFIYIGYDPETGFLKNKLALDEKGFIITGQDMSTSSPGIFACGDCCKKTLYQVINACGDGAVAADSADKYIATFKE
ncbi:MAG: thioredoxin-disulfide reductase [Candidatus Omnitrophica bacterium]|nr:thioredoxin-disulfide reductase [Candidatus Omnitrophota bacterium]